MKLSIQTVTLLASLVRFVTTLNRTVSCSLHGSYCSVLWPLQGGTTSIPVSSICRLMIAVSHSTTFDSCPFPSRGSRRLQQWFFPSLMASVYRVARFMQLVREGPAETTLGSWQGLLSSPPWFLPSMKLLSLPSRSLTWSRLMIWLAFLIGSGLNSTRIKTQEQYEESKTPINAAVWTRHGPKHGHFRIRITALMRASRLIIGRKAAWETGGRMNRSMPDYCCWWRWRHSH